MSTVDALTTGPLAPLAGREARRLARHPVLWLAPVVVAVTSSLDGASGGRNASYWYSTIFIAVAFFGPIFVVFAANLVASGARRGHAEEVLDVTPTADTRRTWAIVLGVALPLAGVGAVAAAAMALIDSAYPIRPADQLTAGELVQLPFILAGAGLLGVLAARWLRFAGGGLVMFLAAMSGVGVFRRIGSGVWWMWWTTGTTSFNDREPGPGEPWLHAAYLAGLCACGALAAVYRHQWRRLALIGAPVLALTLAAGWLQLP
jgi:hypothetical protein